MLNKYRLIIHMLFLMVVQDKLYTPIKAVVVLISTIDKN